MPDRVLIVTRNFPPLVGGIERVAWHAYEELRREFDCTVVGPAGCRAHAARPSDAIECGTKPLPRFLGSALVKALVAAARARPSLVVAGSGLTAPIAATVGALLRVPTAGFVYGLDLVVDDAVYQRAFVPAIRRLGTVIPCSRNTARLAAERGVRPERIQVLLPGVDLPRAPADGAGLRERLGLTGRRLLLFVGRMIPRKGLAELVERSLPAIVAAEPDAVLLVVGDEPRDALLPARGAGRPIEELIAEKGLGDHVVFTGRVEEEVLHQAYAAADVLVFPLRDVPGDVEGFGLVAVEAAAHGLPTVAFAVGGVPDAVADGRSGILVAADDHAAYARAVLGVLRGESTVSRQACLEHARRFAWPRFGDELRRICRGAIEARRRAGVARGQ